MWFKSKPSTPASSQGSNSDKNEKVVVHHDNIGDEEHVTTSSGSGTSYIPPSKQELKRLMWKIDLRIIPFVALLYLCSFLDRVNIGNAKVGGLTEDISITESEYNWALSIFFIGYTVFEVPSNLMLKVIGPRIWITLIMVIWGVIMAAMAACTNGRQLMVARFFLGVAESGLYPGVVFYLSMWYTKRQLALRIAVFYSSSTLAGAFGGVLAYGIMHMDGVQGLHGWQWLFILEALPTIVFGLLCYFVLPDYPKKTSFLNEREREIIVQRMLEDVGPATETHFSWRQVWSALLDWKIYMYSASYILGASVVYALAMFMPSLVRGMGFTDINAQAMSAPPYVFAFFLTVFNGYSTDRFGERGYHLAAAGYISCIGFILLLTLQGHGVVALYISACLATAAAFATSPPMASWFSNNYAGHTRKSVAIAAVLSIGNLGGLISGQVYRADDAPQYLRGHRTCLGLMLGGATIALILKYCLYRINKKRDNLTEEEYQKACEGEDLCDNHPDFRYIL